MHLTDAGPVSTGAPSVVQEEGGNDLTHRQGDGFADTCAQIAISEELPSESARPAGPARKSMGCQWYHICASSRLSRVQFIQLSQVLCYQVCHKVRHSRRRDSE
jgi:hypothetical protein